MEPTVRDLRIEVFEDPTLAGLVKTPYDDPYFFTMYILAENEHQQTAFSAEITVNVTWRCDFDKFSFNEDFPNGLDPPQAKLFRTTS